MKALSNQAVSLADLLEHSQAMLQHAEAGEWEAVADGEMMRRELLDNLFAEAANVADETELSSCLQQILQINQKLQELATQARDQVRADINTIGEGRKAVKAYTDNQR